MAIKPKDLKVSVDGVVDAIEILMDKNILESRSTRGTTSLNVIGDFQVLKHSDLRDEVLKDIVSRYKSAGWGVVHITMDYKSDQRDGAWVNLTYALKEVNEETR